jgi:hypothetical protein
MQCSNCKAKLGCGCHKRVASNGAQVCNSCIIAYESGLIGKVTPVQSVTPPRPIHTNTAPTLVTAAYNPGTLRK